MPMTVLLHLPNEEPILGEIDEMPAPTDSVIIVRNPRKRDGKDVTYLASEVTTVVWPWARINFVEVMPSEEEEKIVGFVRE